MVAQIPATVTVILAAVKRLLTALGPMTPERLLVALHDAGVELGRDPEETLADLLDSDELPLVMPLIDERHALLPALLDGRVFTHRLSAAEIEEGLVAVSPDLEPLSMLADSEPYQQLLDGAPLAVIFPDLDADLLAERGIPVDTISEAPAFLLPPDRLRALGLRPGGLVGFRLTGAGVDVTCVDEGNAVADADVGTRLAAILAGRGDDGPDQLDAVVWTACADDPDLFRTPGRPRRACPQAAEGACEGDQIAPAGFDFDSWRVGKQIESIQLLHDLDDDEALAVLVILSLYGQLADASDAATAAQLYDEAPQTVLEPSEAGPKAVAGRRPSGTDRDVAARADCPDENGLRHVRAGEELQRGSDDAARRDVTVGAARPAAGHRLRQGLARLQDGLWRLVVQLGRGRRVGGISQLPIQTQDHEYGQGFVVIEIVQELDRLDLLPDPPAVEVEAGRSDLVAFARQAGRVEHVRKRRKGRAKQIRIIRARRPDHRVELIGSVVSTPRQDRRQSRAHVCIGHGVALVDAGDVHTRAGKTESDQTPRAQAQRTKPIRREEEGWRLTDRVDRDATFGEQIGVEVRKDHRQGRAVEQLLVWLAVRQHRQGFKIGTDCDQTSSISAAERRWVNTRPSSSAGSRAWRSSISGITNGSSSESSRSASVSSGSRPSSTPASCSATRSRSGVIGPNAVSSRFTAARMTVTVAGIWATIARTVPVRLVAGRAPWGAT